MEDKNRPSSPPPPAPPSSSLVADLFDAKNPPNPSPSLFHSVFPPPSTVMGKDSSRLDIFGPSLKHEARSQTQGAKNVAAAASTSVDVCPPDGTSEGNAHRDENPAYQQGKIDPCSFSSSLYYGGRDIYISTSSHNFGDDYKTDGEDYSNNPHAASRGNWWQGSLYY